MGRCDGVVCREVLVVSPRADDHAALERVFRLEDWLVNHAPNCREALGHLCGREFAVLICSREQDDGDWKLLLQHALGRHNPPRVIVFDRLADESLWVEVLNLGVYDLLALPFDSGEVLRVTAAAARSWGNERQWLRRAHSGN